ncbi:MAG: S1 family peptidase [Bdellovibrionota bacterium]
MNKKNILQNKALTLLFTILFSSFLINNFFLVNIAFAKENNKNIKDNKNIDDSKNIKKTDKHPFLLLKSDTVCASGFFTNNQKIITASHVVKSCVRNNCDHFRIFYNDKNVLFSSLKIDKISYALDIAILDIDFLDEAQKALFKNGIDISKTNKVYPNEELKILGFPKCGNFQISKAVVSEDNNLQIHVLSKIHFGSSGSLVLNKDDKFVGMATKSQSVRSALKSLIVGSTLNANIIKGVHINKLSKLKDSKILPYEISKLNEYYEQNIFNNFSPTRYPNTFNYMVMANNIFVNLPLYKVQGKSFIKDILQSSYNAPYILSNISYSRPLRKAEEDAEKLVLLYSFEKKGFTNNDFKILDATKLKNSFNIVERSKEHKEKLNLIVDNAKKHTQYSYIVSFLATSIWFIILFILIIFFLVFSTGYYSSKFTGSKKRRFLITILFLFTWPISLIVYLFILRKSKKK